MSTLPPCSVLAWSALSPLGRHCSEPSSHAEATEAGTGLEDHGARFGLPGRSGFVRAALPPLPPTLSASESRAARLLVAALEPLIPRIHAGRERYGAERLALVLGSSTGGIDATEEALARRRSEGALPKAYDFEAAHTYDGLLHVGLSLLGIRGPAFVVSTACSSASKAIAVAQRLLVAGFADVVVTGGVDSICELTVRGFAGLSILAADGCRPFSTGRAGISIGEGAALLLLGRETEAANFSLLSAGESNDAYHPTAPHPDGLGAELALRRALTLAGRNPSDVRYVNAHGTGTAQNDAAEALALARVFDGNVAYSSTKDRSGHLLGAAGALEAVLCLEGMRRDEFPENRSTPFDESLAVLPLGAPLRGRWSEDGVVLSNSFAFGGNNVSLALGSHEQRQASRRAPPRRVFVCAAALYGGGFETLEGFARGDGPGEARTAPAEFLPSRVRGRASSLTRLFAELFARLTAQVDGATMAPLFTGSAFGEMPTTLELLAQLGTDPLLSPARFQSSVHNSAAGLLTQQSENRSFSTAIAAGHETFAMTLLDAYTWLQVHGGTATVVVGDADPPRELLGGEGPPNLGLGLLLREAETAPENALFEILGIERSSSSAPAPEFAAFRNALHEAALPWFRDLGLRILGRKTAGAARRYRLGRDWVVVIAEHD